MDHEHRDTHLWLVRERLPAMRRDNQDDPVVQSEILKTGMAGRRCYKLNDVKMDWKNKLASSEASQPLSALRQVVDNLSNGSIVAFKPTAIWLMGQAYPRAGELHGVPRCAPRRKSWTCTRTPAQAGSIGPCQRCGDKFLAHSGEHNSRERSPWLPPSSYQKVSALSLHKT